VRFFHLFIKLYYRKRFESQFARKREIIAAQTADVTTIFSIITGSQEQFVSCHCFISQNASKIPIAFQW
jgi:hypothetical protein